MRAPWRGWLASAVFLWGWTVPNLLATSAWAQPRGQTALGQSASNQATPDQAAAQRVLGPGWRRQARRAGLIFAGTVLSTPEPVPASQTVPGGSGDRIAANHRFGPGAVASIALRFRVDEPIAGVERGQVLTIHEWAGAWSGLRTMVPGQRVLMFFYAPSRLGLTSPVGGAEGQVDLALDPDGTITARQRFPTDTAAVSVRQLKRAIRSAREAGD